MSEIACSNVPCRFEPPHTGKIAKASNPSWIKAFAEARVLIQVKTSMIRNLGGFFAESKKNKTRELGRGVLICWVTVLAAFINSWRYWVG
jgi:hypothetical protein